MSLVTLALPRVISPRIASPRETGATAVSVALSILSQVVCPPIPWAGFFLNGNDDA